jgi:hypothetical protein
MSDKTPLAQDESRTRRPARAGDLDLEHVGQAVKGIRYGEVRVIIQDGVIVQIERVEKHRIR